MKFDDTVVWLKNFLIKNNYEKIANRIDDDWCWPELSEFSQKVKQKVLDLVAKEIIKSGDGVACYNYCRFIEDRDDVREAIIKSGDGWACYNYCRFIEDRDDVREALIKSGNGGACYWYCCDVKDRDDVWEVAGKDGCLRPKKIIN